MSWFKDFFIRKDSQAESIPKTPERKPDISEPVISFVETFKANPKRFRVKKISSEKEDNHIRNFYTLTDTQTKMFWSFSTEHYMAASGASLQIYDQWQYPDFLTIDEYHYIAKVLREYIGPRSTKYYEIKLKRQNRDRLNSVSKQREALKNVYCK